MSSEFAARLVWIETLGLAEAKVLSATLSAALEVPGEEIGELTESDNDLLDALSESILTPDREQTPAWVKQMGKAERSAVGTCLLWLQYPAEEVPELSEIQWGRLEEVLAAVGTRLAILQSREFTMS